ncbi:hypothetical protein A8F94_08300 [Bacillus sp. FJAT-27225]|uniref:ComEA family DNA-binding protein n=1 Tax=Bacillus sp. FJAT-27225 TaxID=1743144 RepID=UPI00080C2385|nr:helix-hairpin-helix domain-containing protein [Bacillus sp. FJAT-27225]OCA87832.1 hypothetical protein A8F94_08300 [Bacillus sp. FJAT-27225]
MTSTKKSALWGFLNSWWILLSFIFLFNWTAFFFVGFKVRHRKWAIWGFIYSVPFILFFIGLETLNTDKWPFNMIMILALLGWISSIIHAFRIRKEYLLRLEALKLINSNEERRMREAIESEYGVRLGKQAPRTVAKQETRQTPRSTEERAIRQVYHTEQQQTPAYEKTTEMNVSPKGNLTDVPEQERIAPKPAEIVQSSLEEPLLDLNEATEEELAQLPGVGLILAKRAVSERTKKGGFRSLDEFTELLNLKPHNIEKIRLLATVKASESVAPQKAGRMVDF